MPMDFTSVGNRVREMMAGRKGTPPIERSSLVPDDLRDAIISEEEQRSERFQSHLHTEEFDLEIEQDDGTKRQETVSYTPFPELIRDVARANFGWDEPELGDKGRMLPSYRLNRDLMEAHLASEEFSESRPYTRDNELESLFGAMASAKSLKDSLRTRLGEHVKNSEEAREIEESLWGPGGMPGEANGGVDGALAEAKADALEQYDAAGEVDAETAQKIKDLAREKRSLLDQLDEADQQQQALDQRAVTHAAEEAAQEGSDVANAVGSLPGFGGGANAGTDPEAQMRAANELMNNPELRKILDLAGRLFRDLRFNRKAKARNSRVERIGVVTGNVLDRMIPDEFVKVVVPELQPIFMRDYAQGSLLLHEYGGEEPAGKGPFVVVQDESGSMMGAANVYSKAVSIAIMRQAIAERRTFVHISYSHGGQLAAWEFPAGENISPDRVLEVASHFFGGGTDTALAMGMAREIIERQPEFSEADIILIGDGQDYFAQDDLEIREALTAMDVRVQGISIGCPNNRYMAQMCDHTIDVTHMNLDGPGEASASLAANFS